MRFQSCLLLVVLLASCSKVIKEEDLFRKRLIHPLSDSVVRKNVEIKMGDLILRGWRLTPEKPRYQMVFFCGIGMNVSREVSRLFWLSEFLDLEIPVVDYPGYGFSDGTATVDGLRYARQMFRAAGTHDKHFCLVPGGGHFALLPNREDPPSLGCLVSFLNVYGEEIPGQPE